MLGVSGHDGEHVVRHVVRLALTALDNDLIEALTAHALGLHRDGLDLVRESVSED